MAKRTRPRAAKKAASALKAPAEVRGGEVPEKILGVEPAALAGAFTLIYIAYRVASVSEWNSTTALALVRIVGTGDVVVAVILSAIPIFLVPLALSAYWQWLRTGKKSKFWEFIGDLLAFLAFYGAPTALVGAAVLVVIIRVVATRVRGLKWAATLLSFQKSDASVVISSFLVVTLFANPAVWLPPENLRVAGNGTDRIVTGYVLDDGDSQLQYLDQDSRLIVRIDIDMLRDRHFCQFSAHRSWLQTPPLSSLVFGKGSDYEACEDSLK